MLQARLKGAKDWYRPDRDYLTVHPRLISQAIATVTTKMKDDKEMESLCEVATELAKIVNASTNRLISKEDMEARLNALDQRYPFITVLLAAEITHLTFELYRNWQMEMLPENPDGTVDMSKLVKPVEVKPIAPQATQ